MSLNEQTGSSRLFVRHEIAPVILLCVISAILLAATALMSRRFEDFRTGLAHRWFERGELAMKQNLPDQASSDFNNALLYDHDNNEYTFLLAQSLAAGRHDAQALPYLLTLWDDEPGNGAVNLELARLEARAGGTDKALQFFHAAIYGEWQLDQQEMRRRARFELVNFLLDRNLFKNAEAELVGLEADLPEDHSMDSQVAAFFLETGDYARALNLYRSSLREQPLASNFAGAGLAAFKLGDYSAAQRYLAQAVAGGAGSTDVRNRLRDAETIGQIDPYQTHITIRQKSERIYLLLSYAGTRLKNCLAVKPTGIASIQAQYDDWKQLQKRVSVNKLRESPDLDDEVMGFVFDSEKLAFPMCGAATEEDSALLLISQSHPNSTR